MTLLLRTVLLRHLVLLLPQPLHLCAQVLVVVQDPEVVARARHHQHVVVIDSQVSLEVRVVRPLQPE